MKYLITESQYNKAIDKFLSLQLIPHSGHRYNNSIYWVKDDEIISEYNIKFNEFWLKRSIWGDIEDVFALERHEVNDVIKKWLEIHKGIDSEKLKVNWQHNFRMPIEAIIYLPEF